VSKRNLEVQSVLEKIVTDNQKLRYSALPKQWQVADIVSFAEGKELYSYQQKALENITSTLYLAFNDRKTEGPNFANLAYEYSQYGAYPSPSNRACFWMATGSGKTLVLVKTIEHIDYLMAQGLIPEKEILILMPKEDLIDQLKEEVRVYNESHMGGRTISLINLAEYERDKWAGFTLFEEIKVYYYRSDLLRDERKQTILDYKTYENDGNWYLLLDEAHRGNIENSNLKENVNAMTKNGFLFNFSATFIDEIDITTTCYNFNLDKFITAGYGKNIYLSSSNFTFNKNQDEFSEAEKQKQVLKSFIVHTLISKSREKGTYHTPLIMTLVNSVNKRDRGQNSDLKLFCNYMLKIAQDDNLVKSVLVDAKRELYDELKDGGKYIFGREKLEVDVDQILNITLDDIRLESFNSKTKGKLEYYEGVRGREIIFKLQSSSEPFALIRIGDTVSFINNYLTGYDELNTFIARDWFSELNEETSTIKVLLGSRAFYEGWDSNRPNIINLINIGRGEARKFVPQSIGRGIRIQPFSSITDRKRLLPGHPSKNILLETLFIFSSDVNSVNVILDAMKELSGKTTKEQSVKIFDEYPELFTITDRKFDLLLPVYKDKELTTATLFDFEISNESKNKFIELFESTSPGAFLISTTRSYSDHWDVDKYIALKSLIQENKFIPTENKTFNNYNYLVSDLRRHILTNEKTLDGVRLINENDLEDESNDIIHFKHIEVNLDDEKRKQLAEKIEIVSNYNTLTKKQIEEILPVDMTRLTDADYMKDYANKIAIMSGKEKEQFVYDKKKINIQKLTNHYYTPLIFSDSMTVNWINHIIKHDSERLFIENLIDFLQSSEAENLEMQWMFSKIDETLDKNLAMPYFMDNRYNNFYPDFIFWIKKGNDYRIVFIDPKGMHQGLLQTYAKIQGFKKYFVENDSPKVFKFKNYNVTFDLKLVNDKPYPNEDEYKPYWVTQDDFSWF